MPWNDYRFPWHRLRKSLPSWLLIAWGKRSQKLWTHTGVLQYRRLVHFELCSVSLLPFLTSSTWSMADLPLLKWNCSLASPAKCLEPTKEKTANLRQQILCNITQVLFCTHCVFCYSNVVCIMGNQLIHTKYTWSQFYINTIHKKYPIWLQA